MSYTEKVTRAAAYLDKYAAQGGISWLTPNWRDKVDVSILDMGTTDRCLLGQVSGKDYGEAVDDLVNVTGRQAWQVTSGVWSSCKEEWTNEVQAIDVTARWVEKGYSTPLKGVQILTVEGTKYIAFISSAGNPNMVTVRDFRRWYETKPTAPFKGGDVLKDQDDKYYLFISEDVVIRTVDMCSVSYGTWLAEDRIFNKSTYRSADYSGMWSGVTFPTK